MIGADFDVINSGFSALSVISILVLYDSTSAIIIMLNILINYDNIIQHILYIYQGPPSKEEVFYRLRDENDKRIHHNLRGADRKHYQREQENWEVATVNTLCISNSLYRLLGWRLVSILN